MAIVNRELDVSEQKKAFVIKTDTILGAAGGITVPLLVVPFQSEVKAIYAAARAISGAPTLEIEAGAFVVGAGYTINSNISTAKAVVASGTSGPVALVLGTAGSTQVRVNAGDLLYGTVVGANTVYNDLTVTIVLQSLQDIKSDFGSST